MSGSDIFVSYLLWYWSQCKQSGYIADSFFQYQCYLTYCAIRCYNRSVLLLLLLLNCCIFSLYPPLFLADILLSPPCHHFQQFWLLYSDVSNFWGWVLQRLSLLLSMTYSQTSGLYENVPFYDLLWTCLSL